MNNVSKILLASDFSKVSEAARETAVLLAERLDAEIEVVHVFDPSILEMPGPYYYMPGVDSWIDEHLAKLKERGQKGLTKLVEKVGGNCKGTFLEGKPGEKIVEHAKKTKADIIVLGTHGHSGWNRLVMGSVAEYVSRHADCAVLTERCHED